MSYRERQRLADIQAAIDAIRSHLQRGDLPAGWSSTRSASACWRSARLLKHSRMTCWPRSRRSRGGRSPVCATTSPIGTSIPPHAILQATVDEDLPDLERAVRALADSLPDEDPPSDSSHK